MDKVTIKHDGRLEFHHDDELMNRIYEAVGSSWNPEYGKIKAPMLAVVPNGNYHPGVPLDAPDELRYAADKYWGEKLLPWIQQRTEAFHQAAPTSHIVEIDSPNHRIFIAKEDETLKAIFNFLAN